MVKPADIGSKRLIGLNPERWVKWITEMPDIKYIGMESTSLEWVSRETLRVRQLLYLGRPQDRTGSQMYC